LNEESSAVKDPDITQLYVEYQFLGFHGQDLETPTVVMKPCSPENHLLYSFKKCKYCIVLCLFSIPSDPYTGKKKITNHRI
jgi:hypothetical protein